MDKQLWQDIETLFHDALQVEDTKRSDFVKGRSAENPQLQSEVLTLLKRHESESGFLESAGNPDWSDSSNQLTDELESGYIGPPLDSQYAPESLRSTSTEDDANQLTKSLIDDGSIEDDSFQATKFEIGVAQRIEKNNADLVVRKVINRGGMGTVLRVYQRKLDRDVAVKVLSVNQVDEVMLRRFIRESKAAAQVKNDHVVGIHEVCSDPELPFLVMELIDGPSLKRYIELEKCLEPTTAAELARQIAVGLAAAHQRHLIHRDIKPANVLLEPYTPKLNESHSMGYRAKIIDFGLARDQDNPSGETKEQLFAGTLYYMSPEQLSDPTSVDHRSDLYSLGITLYQMLTGERPFRGAPHMVMQKIELADPIPPRRLDDRIPKDLESVCLMAIAKDPDRRYQTAQAFADDLARFLEGLPTEARPITTFEKLGRLIGRNKRVAGLAGLAAGLLVLLTVSSLIFAFTVKNKDRQIAAQDSAISNLDQTIDEQRTQTVALKIQRVLDAEAGALPFAIADLDLESEDTLVRIRTEFDSLENDTTRRFNAAAALSQSGSTKTGFILEHLNELYVTPDVFANTLAALERDESALEQLNRSLGPLEGLQEHELADIAKRIILAAFLDDFEPWIKALSNREDLSLNTEIIHTFRKWHGDLITLSDAIDSQSNEDLKWAFCQAIHLIDRRSINQQTHENLARTFQKQVSDSPDFVGYTSAQQVLKNWGIEPIARGLGPNKRWYERDNGLRMVRIEPATSRMGRLEPIKMHLGFPPHDVTITRPFYFSDTEITVGQYLEFVRDSNYPEQLKPFDISIWKYSEVISPSWDHPIQMVSWNDAVLFCNWLSRREGLKPVYRRSPEITDETIEPEKVIYILNDDKSVECEHWDCDLEANGYRLPHEHEFGLASRAGSTSKYFYGSQTEYFTDYGLASNHTRLPASPVRSRLPNRFGIYDVHGNTWEWCNDWFHDMDQKHLTDPVGPDAPDPLRYGRSVRSGGVGTLSGDTDSDARGAQPPQNRHDNLGFRVARYADRDQ